QEHQYDRAIDYFTKELDTHREADANWVGALYLDRGVAYAERHQYEKAIADITRSVQSDSFNNYYAYYNRALVYAMKHQYDVALADISKAIEIMQSIKFKDRSDDHS